MSFYFDCDLGNYTEHLNNEFTLNQLEKIAQITHVHVDFLRDKIGMAIAVGGDRVGGQELAIQQIMTFYILQFINLLYN